MPKWNKHYKQQKYMKTQRPCILYLPLLSVLIPLNLQLKLPIKRTKLKHHKMTTLPINKKNLNSQEYNHANKTEDEKQKHN